MSTNGKGSKRRPETKPGTYVRNWDEINWSSNQPPQRPRPSMGAELERDLQEAKTRDASPFPEPPE